MKEGHIIKDCHICPQNRSASTFYAGFQSIFMPTSSTQPILSGFFSNSTPNQVHHMIFFALFTIGRQGKKHLLTSP